MDIRNYYLSLRRNINLTINSGIMKKLLMTAALMVAAFAFSTEANAQDVKKEVVKKDIRVEKKIDQASKAEVAPQARKVAKFREAPATAEPQKMDIQKKDATLEKKEAPAAEKKLAPAKRIAPVKPVEPKIQDVEKELKER